MHYTKSGFSPDRLRGYRNRAKMSRADLAWAAGTTAPIIRNYETGATIPPVDVADDLAHALHVTAADLTIRDTDPLTDYVTALRHGENLTGEQISAAVSAMRRAGSNPVGGYRRVRVGGAIG